MDLALYSRVLWRFKYLVLAGLVLALALAFLSVKRISFSGGLSVAPRKAQIWKTDSFLLVTQPDFPWGRTVTQYAPGDPKTGAPATAQGDPQRMSSLAALYASIALNDEVRAKIYAPGAHAPQGAVSVSAVPAPAYSSPAILPILDFTATGPTPADAGALSRRAAAAFSSWLRQQQEASGTDFRDRVQLKPVTKVSPAVLISHTGKTLPVIVFLTILGATIGLALVLENARPRPSLKAAAEAAPARQSA